MSLAQTQTLAATTVSLTASVWQAAQPGPSLATLYEQESNWGHFALDLEPTLTRILQATAIGLGLVLADEQ